MMRIKLNLAFVVLSALFCVSSTTAKNIFVDVIAKLAALFQAVIPWPSKDEVENNKPKVFQKFKDIRVIVDCTEIPITKTKCLKCVISTYSQYYGEQTVKYMIGISPGGLATYISLGYGGRATDNAIFSQSSLINMMEPHIDKVMADKGFLIDEICTANFIEVVRPPFLKNGKFLPSECKCTKNIARARVHVERFIQRIKIFKLLHGKIPWNLLSSMDHVFTVVTGLANASNPIMSEKSF